MAMAEADTAARSSREPDEATRASAAAAPGAAPLLLNEDGMLAAEQDFLWPQQKPSYRTGLALSGGGIRAATVALGVLESMASRGLLQRIQYLSTVSGGGYIGTALSWFWSQQRIEQETALAKDPKPVLHRFGSDASGFPFQSRSDHATPLQQAAAANLAFLRQHGSYLTSGDGIGFAGLIMAVVRTVLLSLAVWLPLLIAIFLGIELLDGALTGSRSLGEECLQSQGTAVLNCRPTYSAILAGPAAIALLIFTVTILFAFLSRLHGNRKWSTQLIAVAIVVAATTHIWRKLAELDDVHPAMGAQLIVEGLVAAGALLVAIARLFRSANWSYFLRRTFEKWSSWIIPPAVGAAFFGAMPVIIAGLKPHADAGWLVSLGSVGSLLSLLSGVATALYGYYLKAKSQLPSVAGQFLAITGSLLFLAGLFLLTFLAAHLLVQRQPLTSLTIAVSLFVVAIATGALGSLNATGLHRFYRDRLMETFMPMTDAIAEGSARESDVADTLTIADVVRSAEERGNRPYHLVNAHAILVNEPDPKVALRGGDNFLISPAVVGSATTGWMRSRDYLRLQGPLTLASAMAASGAAANANAGYIGTGVTRDRFLSAVMSILNIRLGLWVANPRKLSQTGWPFRPKVPTYFWPGLTAGILGFGHHHKAQFLELSDGGHFENLGLYELVRRRLDLIIVVDAEQDKAINLSALVSSSNRVREDFQTVIRFSDGKGPEVFLGEETKDKYPRGLPLAKSPFVVAQIDYPAKSGVEPAKTGLLIYLKSTIVHGLDFATLGYRAINPDFPHQTTVDQFFDPDQFQAYRDLGRNSGAIMADTLDLAANFSKPDELLKKYDAWKPGN